MQRNWFLTGDSHGDRFFGGIYCLDFSYEKACVGWERGLIEKMPLSAWYDLFKEGVRAADRCGDQYYDYLVAEYDDSWGLRISTEFVYYLVFAEICMRIAETKSDIEEKRRYLEEAKQHVEKALHVVSHKENEKKHNFINKPNDPGLATFIAKIDSALSALPAKVVAPAPTSQKAATTAARTASATRLTPMQAAINAARTPAAARPAPAPVSRPATVVKQSTRPAPSTSVTRTGPRAALLTAQDALDREEYTEAEKLFEQLCKKQPTHVEAFLGYGISLLKLSEQCEQPKTRKKKLLFAEQQLKQAEKLDKKGDYPKIEAALTDVASQLEQLADLTQDASPTSSNALTSSHGSNQAYSTAAKPGVLMTTSNYEITLGKILGEGAAGTVYQGTWNGETVAIKQYHATQLRGDDLREFLKEAAFMMDLDSPYLIKMHDFVAQSPYYCMVMEYMPQGSLYQVLGSGIDLPWDTRWNIAMDITCGVAALHSKDIVHRDIKSLNVLIGNGFRAKLADFGQAKLKSSSHSIKTRRSESGTVGTVAWLAPEILRDGAECSRATDMYSLGMTLWELATRETPFANAPNLLVMTHWISQGKHENLDKVAQPKLSTLIRRCWESNAALRPSAQQAIEALEEATPKHVSQAMPRMNLFSQ